MLVRECIADGWLVNYFPPSSNARKPWFPSKSFVPPDEQHFHEDPKELQTLIKDTRKEIADLELQRKEYNKRLDELLPRLADASSASPPTDASSISSSISVITHLLSETEGELKRLRGKLDDLWERDACIKIEKETKEELGFMQIFVKLPSGFVQTLTVNQSYTVGYIMEMVQEMHKIPKEEQRMITPDDKNSMLPSKMLRDYNIAPGSTIKLLMRIQGSAPKSKTKGDSHES